MKVLIAMESSGIIRDAFIKRGHNAISCDLLPTDAPGPHYQGDIYDILFTQRWDLIIAHPVCTKLCVSGNHVYAQGKQKYQERLDSVSWTSQFWYDCLEVADKVCFENPVGVLPSMTYLPKPKYIQPYEFGHNASKKTGLYLYDLEPLKPTLRIIGRMVEWPKGSGKMMERWDNQTDSGQNKLGPSEDRAKIRSQTYQGWADAMAALWG